MKWLKLYWRRIAYIVLVIVGVIGFTTGYANAHPRFRLSSILAIVVGVALFLADVKGYTHHSNKRK